MSRCYSAKTHAQCLVVYHKSLALTEPALSSEQVMKQQDARMSDMQTSTWQLYWMNFLDKCVLKQADMIVPVRADAPS